MEFGHAGPGHGVRTIKTNCTGRQILTWYPAVTTANKVTILRVLLIPFFVGATITYVRIGDEGWRLAAILCFAIAAICDGVDGYIARRYAQVSELGKVLDPLADKLLLVSGIVLLSFDNAPYFVRIPLWLTMTIIGRDVLILIGVIVIHFTVGKVNVRPRLSGKVATVFQMIVVIWILLRWNTVYHGRLISVWVLGAGIFTAVSGLFYTWDAMKQLGEHPSSSAGTGNPGTGNPNS